jgi:hypothetical protein
MITVKTQSNFEVSVNEKIIRDWDFVCCLTDMQSKDIDDLKKVGLMRKLLELLLGAKGSESLKQNVRDNNDGICDVETLMKEITSIIEGIKGNKQTKN